MSDEHITIPKAYLAELESIRARVAELERELEIRLARIGTLEGRLVCNAIDAAMRAEG